MKLGKLLGAGKSFFGWQGSVTYRENKQVYLPNFNPGKNPFTPKKAEPAAPAPKAMARVEVEPQAMPALALAPTPVTVPVVASPARVPNWTEKLNPFRGGKPAKTAPTVPMPNVQPEFSLNAVKVVHNDLSDADVEVVPMKSRSAAPVAAPANPMPMEFLGEPVLKSL